MAGWSSATSFGDKETVPLNLEPRPDSNRGPFPYQVTSVPGEFDSILARHRSFGRDHLTRAQHRMFSSHPNG
jgi:hypothetical protein